MTQDPCETCGNPIPYGRTRFCSGACYSDVRAELNRARSKFVFLHGAPTPITHVMKTLGLNHYSVSRKILAEEDGLAPYPDRETYVGGELAKLYAKNPTAPTREDFLEAKACRVSLKALAERHGVKPALVHSLCVLHGIDTMFAQVDPGVHATLDYDGLKQRLAAGLTTQEIADQEGCSPALVQQKIRACGLYIAPSFSSQGEREVGEFLNSLGIDTKKHKIGKNEIDVFSEEHQIGVEYNGIFWHSDKHKTRTYHQEKYLAAHEAGIHLIQIWDCQWDKQRPLIERKLAHVFRQGGAAVGARKCSLVNVSPGDARIFYTANHLMGFKGGRHVGLVAPRGDLVACLTMQGEKLERYATALSVPGGFTRLLTHAIARTGVSRVTTFADLFWSNHETSQYATNRFRFEKITEPNYFWCKDGLMHSRVKFQKHRLTQFPNYAPEKSESEILTEAGYLRVYDAGHAKYVLEV